MASPVFAFYLTCLLLGKMAPTAALKSTSSVHQERPLVFVKNGDNLTLQCFYEGDVAARLYWYKQTLGEKTRLMSTFFKFDKNETFYDEFKNPRFTLDTENGKNHITITDLRNSDSATYFCMSSCLYNLEVSESITVIVEGSGLNIPALVHQSTSETIQPGGSVTLNCTVHTGTCDGEHRVYWFRHSEESHPGLIYTHGGREDQCERKPEAQTHTCVYNLPMESVSLSHAGTYYCAVASCGYVVFGNGTKLEYEDEVGLVYFLSAVLAFATILIVVLAFSVCMMNKRHSCQPTESPGRLGAPSTVNEEGHKQTDSLLYAALSVKLSSRSRRQRDQTWSECVFYTVKQ
ncbi:signal-regulatory protein beta-2-like [Pempheris klunzingeri]|uniref:signal-regulatory protein beta-2-like n=1 Tax=Pempheris klunzingeri TaxID=3127111 RepID=UPI0039803276